MKPNLKSKSLDKKTGDRELYQRVRQILESARTGVARTVNTTQVVANWLVGREIVEEQQRGEKRAGYGQRLVADLSRMITHDFGQGYSITNLEHFRDFYLTYPQLLTERIPHAASGNSDAGQIPHAVRGEFGGGSIPSALRPPSASAMLDAPHREFKAPAIKSQLRYARRSQSWQPGQLHSNLSWTHYRMLLRVEKPEARSFYEIEAIQNNWAARELERQINSLLYERLALSRDKKGLLRLARKGQEIQGPLDVFKDPLVLEFLKIPTSPKLVESALEEALLNDLQSFLLELGKGFAFLARQERITLEGDHFYIDLVFYHTILKCYVLVDLKVGKLTHQDLGQLQLYVNYFDRHRLSDGDNPTLGLILCTDKNDAVVQYTLGADKRIFASRYKLHLPSEAELKSELLRELKRIGPAVSARPRSATKKLKP
jgi:predicted nuclease of restriction endonuclease-like (RecB) superfamily